MEKNEKTSKKKEMPSVKIKVDIKNKEDKKKILHEKSKLEEEIKVKKEEIDDKDLEEVPLKNINLNQKTNVSLEKVASSNAQRIPFFGRGTAERDSAVQNNENNNSEYISNPQNKDSPKYQHYEHDVQLNMKRPDEINLSLQNKLKDSEIGFMPSESAGIGKDVHYETYVSPKKFNAEEFSKDKNQKRIAEKKEMDYHLK